MPPKNKAKVGQVANSTIKLPGNPLGIQKPKIRRMRNYALKRKFAYQSIKDVGQSIGSSSGLKLDLSKIVYDKDMRVNFFSRVFDDKGVMVKSGIFGGRFRSTWDEQDELLSTASVRSFVQGILNGRSKDELTKVETELYNYVIDVCSSLRIATRYSGFSTSKEVMQHPTAVGTGFFSAKAVDGSHTSYDSERVKYVGDALQNSKAQNDSIEEQARVMMRAAIEFSLNYFTAPITASNVLPFSTKKGQKVTNPTLLNQIAARERIKGIYVKLGGELRKLESQDDKAVEEPEDESLTRPWQRDLVLTSTDKFPFAPPSPRRERRKKKDSDKTPDSKVPLKSDTLPSNPFGSNVSLFQTQPFLQTSSSQSVQGPNSVFNANGPQSTLTIGSVQMPKLNLGPVRVMPVLLPSGDVLPQANNVASKKRQREKPQSEDMKRKISRQFEDEASQFPDLDINPDLSPLESLFPELGCWSFDPSLSFLNNFSQFDLGQFDLGQTEEMQSSFNLWDTSPSAPPMEEVMENGEQFYFDHYDPRLDAFLEQSQSPMTLFDESDEIDENMFEDEEPQIIENNVIDNPFAQGDMGEEMLNEPYSGISETQLDQLMALKVPDHPLVNDPVDPMTDVGGNVIGEGIGGIEGAGASDAALELVALL